MKERISRLAWEWRNRDEEHGLRPDGSTVSLEPVRGALRGRFDGMSYGEVVDLAQQELEHRHDNPEFIAALLHLLDTRPVSAQTLQVLVGLQGGHLYRFLDRAGVDWAASNGVKHNLRRRAEDDGLATRIGYYFSPLHKAILADGHVRLVRDDDEVWDTLASVPRPPRPPRWPRFGAWLNVHRRRARRT